MIALWLVLVQTEPVAPWPVFMRDGMAYVKADGQMAFSQQFEYAGEFSEGLAPVVHEGRAGFVNMRGEVVMQFNATRSGEFHEGRAAIINGGSVAYVDKQGALKVQPRYRTFPTGNSEWGDFHEGRACVLMPGGYGFVDLEGREVIKGILKAPSVFSEGLAAAKTTEGNGFINLEGDLVISGYEPLGAFSEGVAPVRGPNGVGFVDQEGILQLGGSWQAAGEFANGRAWVVANGRLGFINRTGTFAVNPKFGFAPVPSEPSAGNLAEDLVWVIEGQGDERKVAFVNRSGSYAFPLRVDFATDFRDGRSYVVIGINQALIDTEGNIVWQKPLE